VLPIARKPVRQRQDQESNVFSFGYQPAAILEEKGQDYFSPARPQPTEHLLPLPQLMAWLDRTGPPVNGWQINAQASKSGRRVLADRQQPMPALQLTVLLDPNP